MSWAERGRRRRLRRSRAVRHDVRGGDRAGRKRTRRALRRRAAALRPGRPAGDRRHAVAVVVGRQVGAARRGRRARRRRPPRSRTCRSRCRSGRRPTTRARAITADHLLAMRDGLAFVEDYVDAGLSDVIEMLFGAGQYDVAHFAADRPLAHPPDTVFNYSSGSSNIVARRVGDVVGPIEPFLHEGGLRAARYAVGDDPHRRRGHVHRLVVRLRDRARLGEVRAVLPATTGRTSCRPNGWRTARGNDRSIPRTDGRTARTGGCSRSDPPAFYASGYEGQRVVVCPQLDLVFVRFGRSEADAVRRPPRWCKDVDRGLYGRAMTEPLIDRSTRLARHRRSVRRPHGRAVGPPTECPGWTVHDNVAHMIGTERMLLGEQPAPPAASVTRRTCATTSARRTSSGSRRTAAGRAPKLLDEFRVGHRPPPRRAARDDPPRTGTRRASRPKVPGPYRQFMAIRVFDCWYHDQDIREAIDRPGFLDGAVADLSLGADPGEGARLRRREEGGRARRARRSCSTSRVRRRSSRPSPCRPKDARCCSTSVPADPDGAHHDRSAHVRATRGRTLDRRARTPAARSCGRRRRRARRPCRRQHGVHDLTISHISPLSAGPARVSRCQRLGRRSEERHAAGVPAATAGLGRGLRRTSTAMPAGNSAAVGRSRPSSASRCSSWRSGLPIRAGVIGWGSGPAPAECTAAVPAPVESTTITTPCETTSTVFVTTSTVISATSTVRLETSTSTSSTSTEVVGTVGSTATGAIPAAPEPTASRSPVRRRGPGRDRARPARRGHARGLARAASCSPTGLTPRTSGAGVGTPARRGGVVTSTGGSRCSRSDWVGALVRLQQVQVMAGSRAATRAAGVVGPPTTPRVGRRGRFLSPVRRRVRWRSSLGIVSRVRRKNRSTVRGRESPAVRREAGAGSRARDRQPSAAQPRAHADEARRHGRARVPRCPTGWSPARASPASAVPTPSRCSWTGARCARPTIR